MVNDANLQAQQLTPEQIAAATTEAEANRSDPFPTPAELADDPSFIETRQGEEHHTSNWGKFVVKGLNLALEERTSDRHHNYATECASVPSGTVFTVWISDGDKYGTGFAEFLICRADPQAPVTRLHGCYKTWIVGRFEVLADGLGKIKSTRLLGWWTADKSLQSSDYARHLAVSIAKRGITTPPPMTTGSEAVS